MKGRHVKLATIPSMEDVDKERQRLDYRDRYVRVLKSTVYALVVVAAAAVLLATILLPVLQVSGDSMICFCRAGMSCCCSRPMI